MQTCISPNTHRFSLLGFSCVLFVLFAVLGGQVSAGVSLNSEEQTLARFLTTSAGQHRDRSQMVADPRLCQVARARAADMARRKYFSHVNPEGLGPNALVRAAGYPLPGYYSTAPAGNSVESISAGYADAGAAWTGWMGSAAHKSHLLATESFYQDQTTFGVGYYYDTASPYGRYYVVITAPPSGGTLNLTSPVNGTRVTEDHVVVTGKVSGSTTVAQLIYRLENSGSTSDWQQAAVPSGSATGAWSAEVQGLTLGENTIRVRTLNAAGDILREVTRIVRMVILKPLTVEVIGSGKVTTGFEGTAERELGELLSIRATPKAGYIFSHWDGFPDSAARDIRLPSQSFEMSDGLVLRAHFIPNPFVAQAGSYSGLFTGAQSNFESTGVLRLTLTSNGGFSGQLNIGASQFRLRGTLNSAGTATVVIKDTGLVLELQLNLSDPSQPLRAALSDGNEQWSAQADRRAATDKPNKRTIRHTFRISPDQEVPESPQGFGFATMQVTSSNAVSMKGSLADGRKFTASALLGQNGDVSLYVPLFGKRGVFIAPLHISGDALTGTGRWFNPERPNDPIAGTAFRSTHEITGGVYNYPITHGGPNQTANFGMTLSAGDLSSPLTQVVTLDLKGRFAWTDSTTPGLKLQVQSATGLVTGSFIHPLGGRRILRGVMTGNEGSVYGAFAGSSEGGSLVVVAP